MAGNSTLISVKDQGWLQGYGNLARREHAGWWKTRTWLAQALIWIAIVDGMLAMVVLVAPKIEAAQQARELAGAPAQAPLSDTAQTGLMVLLTIGAMAPAVGAMIFGMESLLEEKLTGTAGWILSKPVSRSAFVLSKFSTHAVGVLVTMIILPGIGGYLIFQVVGMEISIGGLAAAMGLVYLSLLFYLALATLLGTVFNSRGPVIGILLGLIFGYQLFLGIAPWLGQIMPWGLTVTLDPQIPSQTMALAQGQPLTNPVPLIATLIWTALFIGLAIWRFHREEL